MITKKILDGIEKYADKLFKSVGIDVVFTKHFLDRVNDRRNQKDITQSELIRLFKQTHKKYGKKIAKLGADAEAVITDMKTDVNMPFILTWDKVNQEIDLIAKTVMRKKDFKTPDQRFAFEDRLMGFKEFTQNEDLRNWFKSDWVNIAKKNPDGSHPPCGTSGDKSGYAKCVPKSVADKMTDKEKESAVRRKRAAQNKADRGGKKSDGQGKKPISVSTYTKRSGKKSGTWMGS